MGKISLLTTTQKAVLTALSTHSYITKHGYFTGGTALSTYYLHHRESEDIDIFSLDSWDSHIVLDILTGFMKSDGGTIQTRLVDPVHIYILKFKDGRTLKVDVSKYPYPLLEDSGIRFGDLRVDSQIDIAVNKLLAITQRTEVKDYVDLYYLLQKYTFWDLKEGVAQKFHIDTYPMFISQDYIAVEEFTHLPKMYTDLTLDELKLFFRKQAIELGKTMVE